jgi:hypothetical protein
LLLSLVGLLLGHFTIDVGRFVSFTGYRTFVLLHMSLSSTQLALTRDLLHFLSSQYALGHQLKPLQGFLKLEGHGAFFIAGVISLFELVEVIMGNVILAGHEGEILCL